MTAFDSTKTELRILLEEIQNGKLQLPDFQRGWVWNDEHIRSLLVSISRSFPIGAVMLLETGGETKFQIRPVEGVTPTQNKPAERLILDGQQRLTSLTQVLKLSTPVKTKDDKKREIDRFYYIDINKALANTSLPEDAIFGVPEDRIVKENFGRDVKLDLSTPEKEFATFNFPCNQILNSDKWEEGLMAFSTERFGRYMPFRKTVLAAFRGYNVPVITLQKETPKDAVCVVFEKVNTGGVVLTVFELVTASYAAEGHNLREDWFGQGTKKGRRAKFVAKPLIKNLAETDFLQGISLLHTYEKQQQDIEDLKTGKEITGVSAKREHILSLPLSSYKRWADPLTAGFLETEKFLRHIGFHNPKDLPYQAQLIPLGCVLANIKERWLEPKIQNKLTQWFWCGVFGELYGSASETRIALDMQNLMRWILEPDAPEPDTITSAGFQPMRLNTLRTRNSAAYRGLYDLLQQHGAKDFYWQSKIVELDRDDRKIDIHHIFPKKWCRENGISDRDCDSIINKTAISYKANRMIGGRAPSLYLTQLQKHKNVQANDATMDGILKSHLIDPAMLRADDFAKFFDLRRNLLLALIEKAMGKAAVATAEAVAEDEVDLEEEFEAEGEGTEAAAESSEE